LSASGTRSPRWSIPLADTSIGEEEQRAVRRVLESGWLTAGEQTELFEREFAARVGADHALAVANGTAALHLAYLALDLGPGDEVLCPVLTFVATANAARYTGAEVVFCDVVGPNDLTVDPADVERKITPRTRAIAVMHYGGFPCRMDEILDLARRRGLPVVEDCAHAPLARHAGRDGTLRGLGALGAAGCFSFFGNKNMTTGEGGMLTTGDERLAARVRLLRSHGMSTASYDRFRGHAQGYDVTALGFNYRLDDVRAALGRAQLARLDDLHERRRRVFAWYAEELEGIERIGLPFAERELAQATPHILSVVVHDGLPRMRQRLAEAGIQTSRHYDLVTSFSIYRRARGATPVAAGLELLTLPFGPALTREQVARIGAVIRGA
jgi:dTDP-4-amino-4,6-dideoxygalactose transaminase